MKFFTTLSATSLVLIFESLLLQSGAEPVQKLYSKTEYLASDVCESASDEETCTKTDLFDQLHSCEWAFGKCFLMVEEDICEFGHNNSEESCNKSSGCAWLTPEPGRPGEGECLSYKNINSRGCKFSTSSRVYSIKDKLKCNDIKGCAWYSGNGGKKTCQVAPSQIECQAIDNKNACKSSGCDWKKKGKVCQGRWEPKFLHFLVGKDAEHAKLALRAEYGETYTVHVEEPQLHVPERITLVVNDSSVVVETPQFG